jgi:hypothetical protein
MDKIPFTITEPFPSALDAQREYIGAGLEGYSFASHGRWWFYRPPIGPDNTVAYGVILDTTNMEKHSFQLTNTNEWIEECRAATQVLGVTA